MGWLVEWTVIGGHSGPRPDRNPTRLYQGDHVRFTLRLRNEYQYALEMAEENRNWQDRPKLLVRGFEGATTTTHASEQTPLVIDYIFRYEGTKYLRFRGVPRELVNPIQRTPRRDRNGELVREPMFPELDIMREIRVMSSTSRGEAVASTAGAQSPNARRQQREVDQRRELANQLERRQQQEREEALEVLDDEAGQRRQAAIATRGRLSQRGVLLGINLLEAHRLSTRSIEEVQFYLSRLQSSISVTPALNLYNEPWEDVPNQGFTPRTRFRQQRLAWTVEGENRLVKVRQYRYKFGANTPRGIDQRPNLNTNIPIQTIRLRSSDWLVVKFERGGQKALIPVEAAIQSIQNEQLIELARAVVSLASMAVAISTSPASFAFEVLSNTLLPESVSSALGIASISVSISRGLARLFSRLIQNSSALSAANTALLRRLARMIRRGNVPSRPPVNPRGTGAGITDVQRGLSPRTGRTLPGIGPGPDDIGHARTLPGARSGGTQPGVGPSPDGIGQARTLPGPRSGGTQPGVGTGPDDIGHARTLPDPNGGGTGRTRTQRGVGHTPNDPAYARTLPDARSTTMPQRAGRPGDPLPSPDGRVMQRGNGNSVLRELTAEEIARLRHHRRTYVPEHRISPRDSGEVRVSGPTEGVMYQDYWTSAGGYGPAPHHGFMIISEGRPMIVMNNSLMPSGTPGLHVPFTETVR